MMKKLLAAVLLLAMLLNLTACGQKQTSADDGQTPVEQEQPAEQKQPTEQEQPAEQEQPTEQEQPAEQEQPTEQEQPAEQEQPTEQEQPVEQEQPTEQEQPVAPKSIGEQLMEYKILKGASANNRRITQAQAEVRAMVRELNNGIAPSIGLDKLSVSYDTAVGYTSPDKEILIGNTNRKESVEANKNLGSMDYLIKIEGSKIILTGGTTFSILSAAQKFVELVNNGTITDTSTAYTYKYEFEKEHVMHPLSTDISSFVPVWTGLHTPAPWVGDFYESLFTVTHKASEGAGRPAVHAHRGDFSYYPESSMECFVSAYLAGCDTVEVDIRVSKDNIPVCFHDSNMSDNTNVKEMMGKNGLPNSAQLSDWTYEELKQLRYVKNGVITEYQIVSFYEVLKFLDGKMLLGIDDKAKVGFETEDDLYPLARDTNSMECFFRQLKIDVMRVWAERPEADADFKETVKFLNLCLQTGSGIVGTYGIYKAPNWDGDYETQQEGETDWTTYLNANKRYLVTNRVVALCEYLGKVRKTSDYSALLEKMKQ